MADKRDKEKRRRDAAREATKDGKTLYEKIRDGEIEPTGSQKGWLNIKPIPLTERPEEEAREIRRKGAEAVNKLHGEKKTARESLQRMLSILATDEIIANADMDKALAERLRKENPDMTVYDVLNAAAIGRAISGNVKAAEYVRDTAGDKPTEKIDITGQIMTDQDRALLENVQARLDKSEITVIQDNTQA